MEESIRLGRIAGIRVGVNWSVLVMFWLVGWSLAAVVFPEQVPGRSALAYWTAGAGTAVLFFASLLAHELGHALLARRAGLGVEGITLWLFGGVAKLTGEAADPSTEARIAGSRPAGPMEACPRVSRAEGPAMVGPDGPAGRRRSRVRL